MSSAVLQFLGSLAPPPQLSSEEYQGTEYRWKFFTFRPDVVKYDLIWVALIVAYVGVWLMGKSSNRKRALAWFEAHSAIYTAQFSKPAGPTGLIADGSTDLFNFSTGRRTIATLHTVFRLLPRHDLAQAIYQLLWGAVDLKYKPEDLIELDFTFDEKASAQFPDFVWAVVAKDQLSTIKDSRWDLTFTKTTENPAVPIFSVMSEVADLTENLLKPSGTFSLTKLLSDPAILPYFRSLSLTDQPSSRPLTPKAPLKRLLVTLALPPVASASATVAFVKGLFQFADALAGVNPGAVGRPLLANIRPDTKSKLKKKREELAKEVQEEGSKDRKEEEREVREAAKRKAEQERIAKLSASEQQKELDRERKRNIRKTQGKMVRK